MIRHLAALFFLVGFHLSDSAHAEPVPIAQTRAEAVLVEALAFDRRDRLLVSSVHRPGIYLLRKNGALKRWSAEGATEGVFGIAADPARGDLWAASSGTAHGGDPRARPALIRFNLRNGRVRSVHEGPQGAKSFGDLAIGPDGAVYVSDSGSGVVLRLRPGGVALEPLVSLGPRGSPQGLAVSPDGRTLVFVGYGSGLHRVDLESGAHSRIETPNGMELRGVDGVTRDGEDLLLVQNGIAPPRILRLELNDAWSAVDELHVLARDAGMQEPTSGVVRDGAFVFISRSQWTDFDAEGRPKSPTPAPAVISRLALAAPPAR